MCVIKKKTGRNGYAVWQKNLQRTICNFICIYFSCKRSETGSCLQYDHPPDTSKETITSDDVTFDFFDTQDPSEYHIVYEVNGGINSSNNQKTIQKEELPFTLDVPVKMGYNFAGWYADCSYSRKVTKIDEDSPANMVLLQNGQKILTIIIMWKCILIRQARFVTTVRKS